MIDNSLMCDLLKAIKPGARLILVGDADQLPSVGAGNVLHDVLQSECFSTVKLTEIFRQAGQSLIITNAHRINEGQMPILNVNNNDFFFMPRESDSTIASTIAELCYRRLPKAYGADIRPQIQVITPSRRGEGGTENLNRLLQNVLNPKAENKAEHVTREKVFRVGDKVMQIKNNYDIVWKDDDKNVGMGVFNGDVGVLESIDVRSRTLKVRFLDRVAEYTGDEVMQLELAYAVTIHKSQGQTYARTCVDPACFDIGQLYVALSRCRSLEGISLCAPLHSYAIYSDHHVSEFNSMIPPHEKVGSALESEERRYIFEQLRDLFTFDSVTKASGWFIKLWREKLEELYPAEYQSIMGARSKIEEASKVADTFRIQLHKIECSSLPDDSYLKERSAKAAAYFLPLMEDSREKFTEASELEVDNKETRRKIKEAADELLAYLEILCRSFEALGAGDCSVETLCRIRTECMLEERKGTRRRRLKKLEHKEGEPGVVNEALRERLQQWRTERFKADNVPAYTIMHQSTLLEIAALVPVTKAQLMAIKGFGDAKYSKYGEELLGICTEFVKDNENRQ